MTSTNAARQCTPAASSSATASGNTAAPAPPHTWYWLSACARRGPARRIVSAWADGVRPIAPTPATSIAATSSGSEGAKAAAVSAAAASSGERADLEQPVCRAAPDEPRAAERAEHLADEGQRQRRRCSRPGARAGPAPWRRPPTSARSSARSRRRAATAANALRAGRVPGVAAPVGFGGRADDGRRSDPAASGRRQAERALDDGVLVVAHARDRAHRRRVEPPVAHEARRRRARRRPGRRPSRRRARLAVLRRAAAWVSEVDALERRRARRPPAAGRPAATGAMRHAGALGLARPRRRPAAEVALTASRRSQVAREKTNSPDASALAWECLRDVAAEEDDVAACRPTALKKL